LCHLRNETRAFSRNWCGSIIGTFLKSAMDDIPERFILPRPQIRDAALDSTDPDLRDPDLHKGAMRHFGKPHSSWHVGCKLRRLSQRPPSAVP
jgi:hypothetical protein